MSIKHLKSIDDIDMIRTFIMYASLSLLFLMLGIKDVSYFVGLLILWIRAIYYSYKIITASKESYEKNYQPERDCGRFEAAMYFFMFPLAWPLFTFFSLLLCLMLIPKALDLLIYGE